MLLEQKEKLQSVVDMVEKMAVDPSIDIDYFIPGVLVTKDTPVGGTNEAGPYIEFSYSPDGLNPHVQHMRLTRSYLEKSPNDLTNLITFSLEQFMGEIDSRQYGAQ